MSSPPDCLDCGACCVSPFLGDGYIQLAEQEIPLIRLLSLPVIDMVDDYAEDGRIVLLGTRINKEGHRVCRALGGKIGRHVECSIYESRPGLCREFEAGSPECFQARRAVGIS